MKVIFSPTSRGPMSLRFPKFPDSNSSKKTGWANWGTYGGPLKKPTVGASRFGGCVFLELQIYGEDIQIFFQVFVFFSKIWKLYSVSS